MYLSAYKCALISSKYRSLSSKTPNYGTTSVVTQYDCATRNGNGWHILTWSDYNLVHDLLFMLGNSCYLKSVYGGGHYYFTTTGEQNGLGLFYAPAGASSYSSHTKCFGMEDWWGSYGDYLAGINIVSTVGNVCVKMTPGTIDGSGTSGYNTSGTGYIPVGPAANKAGYIKTTNYSSYGRIIAGVDPNISSSYYRDYYQGGSIGTGTYYCHCIPTNSVYGPFSQGYAYNQYCGARLSYR